jgi:translocation and assembly module TamB
MGRRRLVVLVSALMMLLIGAAAVAGFVAATQSEGGRDWIRRAVQSQLTRVTHGSFHLGTLSGSFITDLQIDSLEIRDDEDSLFAAAGPIRLTFDPRDLMDGRLFIRTVEVQRPNVTMRRAADGVWMNDRIWPKTPGPRRARSAASFGSVLVLEQVAVRDGRFALTMPWTPADSLRGAARDSAITEALTSTVHETRRARDGFARTWRWSGIQADVPRLRLSYPDSAGRRFDIARLDVNETDPPFAFRDLQGDVRWIADSIWFTLPRFTLAGSAGHAEGKIWFGSDLPTRYRVHVVGDTVSLADVAWIAPSLPNTGGGRMVLDLTNARDVPNALQYAITDMDVRSHSSRIRGRMTWVIGGPVTILRDVDLEAAPIDFRLIERFNQGPFPYPFAGTIRGRFRARGGPLNRFVVDDATIAYRDGNVEGAGARARARGEIDILDPGNTVFRGFTVTLDTFDLRTPQFLNADFPRLKGLIAGSARLDSSWLDVRFSDADLTHHDGDLPVSRFRGAGRITSGDSAMAYDVDMVALPLSFTSLVNSFPSIPLRGDFSGPLHARGTLADLFVNTDLTGEAGRIEADVRMDAEAPRYRLTGRTSITGFDPRVAFDDARMPTGELTARLQLVDLGGDSLANLTGSGTLAVDRSTLDGVRIFTGEARVRFADGRAQVDTMHLETTAVEVNAGGALGLRADRSDSLQVHMRVDSLGGLRRWLASEVADTLDGRVLLSGVATGWVKEFAFDGSLDGTELLVGTSGTRLLTGTAALTGLPSMPAGTLTLAADTMRVAGFGITRLFTRATLDSSGGAAIDVQVAGGSGTLGRGHGYVARDADTVRARLDSLVLATGLQRWALATPAAFTSSPTGFAVDSFVLRGTSAALVRFGGVLPSDGALDLRLNATGLPVADLAELLQVGGTQEGRIDFDARLRGTRAAPDLQVTSTLVNGLVRGIRLDTLAARATATADALRFNAALGPAARPVMRAEGTLPFSLGLDGAGPAMIGAAPIAATVRSDTVSLSIFDALTNPRAGDPGTFALNLDVSGTWSQPRVDGGLLVRNGNVTFAPLGDVRWRNLAADIRLEGDSIAIRRLSATSNSAGRNGRASVNGWVTIRDRANPFFDVSVRANTFHVYNVRNVADIDLSDSLRIDGSFRRATLRGGLTADRAFISIPEIATKNVISLDEFDHFGIVDTSSLLDQRLIPRQPSVFIDNLTVLDVPVRMGRDVWLRSAEANINLGGEVSITRGMVRRGRDAGLAQLALTGALQTVRGTYRLNVGPVQRTFEVEDGEIQFFGDAEFNPSIDISALHTVRQYSKQGSQPDVRVRVHLGGTLRNPTAELSTPDSARVKNADLISYLVTGGPSFEIASRNADYTSTATRVVLSSLGSILGGKAAGGLCDDAQLSTGTGQSTRGVANVGSSVLEGARFNCAKQLGTKAFWRLDAGLCQVGQFVSGSNGGSALALANSIGWKLDYLLRPGLTLSAGVEPPTSAVLCSQNVSARGFVPTPQQLGFDLFRVWRF